jgi:hypothetical protein
LAVVILEGTLNGDGGGIDAFMGFAVSGATTIAAADANSISVNGTTPLQVKNFFVVTGLTAGSNTFTAKYKAETATGGTFANRSIVVLP